MADETTTKTKTEFLVEGDVEPISTAEIDVICGGQPQTGSTIDSFDIGELFADGDLSDNENYSTRPVDIPGGDDAEPIEDDEINSILNDF